MKNNDPLCIDLDGTLLRTDTLWELCWRLLISHPLLFLKCLASLNKGRAYFKYRLASLVDITAIELPFNKQLLNHLNEQKKLARPIYLATAANKQVADSIAKSTNLFDDTIASDAEHNLKAANKAARLSEQFGNKKFSYAGNSSDDLPVWEQAKDVLIVNATASVTQKAYAINKDALVFDKRKNSLRTFFKAIRVHQFAKNLLVVFPLLAAHLYTSCNAIISTIIAFLVFCLTAGSVYLLNDLVDLDVDRQHDTKCKRPLAAGDLSIPAGMLGTVSLLALAVIIAALLLNTAFILTIIAYYILTLSYSFALKQKALLDVFTLSILYTLRIIAGITALNAAFSSWLLMFSIFFFLSLAFLKRDVELSKLVAKNLTEMLDKGYKTSDQIMIRCFGIAAGFMSIVILALYINSSAVIPLYHSPQWLWGALLVIFSWIIYLWFMAGRGEMNEDPVLFAIKDVTSIIHGIAVLVFTILAIT